MQAVLNEEWAHRLYAERDFDVLEFRSSLTREDFPTRRQRMRWWTFAEDDGLGVVSAIQGAASLMSSTPASAQM
ncbi:MAG: hypothetical protein QOE89_2718 [Pseudonocardiales bacterium]|nr:hypothetical protein [Pseudonocardiales bacterium]